MLLTIFKNWVIKQILYAFLILYRNIDYYTLHKHHTPQNWFFYMYESYQILAFKPIKLFFHIFYLLVTSFFIFNWHKPFVFYKGIYKVFNYILIWFRGGFFLNKLFFYFSGIRLYRNKTNKVKKNPRVLANILGLKCILIKFYNDKNIWYIFSLIYIFFKTTILALVLGCLVCIYLVFFFQLSFLKQAGLWFIVLNLFFWLISGFNFFIKRYRFGKFTSAIQRFWKRANMCFWLVEGFLFSLFYYYFLNSSQEPLYMYDYSSLNQEYLLSLVTAYKTLVLLSFIIFVSTILLLNISSLSFYQNVFFITYLSYLLFNIFFIESYQFYYVITLFNEGSWIYNDDLNLWKYTYEAPRLRTKHYYFLMCLIAKYWHFIFIFISWLFFILKFIELRRIKYNLLSYNIQNLIILYMLNLLTYSQWLKWLFHRYFESIYFWFYTDYDSKFYSFLASEISLFINNFFFFGIFDLNVNYYDILIFSYNFFIYGDNFLYSEIYNLIDYC